MVEQRERELKGQCQWCRMGFRRLVLWSGRGMAQWLALELVRQSLGLGRAEQ